MKIVYCIADLYNPGGMERVLQRKLLWLSAKGSYELSVVTTDQGGRPTFFELPQGVRMTDLGINYKADKERNPVAKTLSYLRKRRQHRKALTEYLMQEKADIVVSLYPSESSFIPSISDGSKKILELHFNRFFRVQYGRSGLLGLADRLRFRRDPAIVRRFDRFVVLTRQDAALWGVLPNLCVIPNAAPSLPETRFNPESRRVIAVGRLDYQKGFDRLIEAWALVPRWLRKEWRLDIFGQGEWEEMLKERIDDLGLSGSAAINPPTKEIYAEYAKSAFLVMSSHYEGFPMVMIEAMSCGLPVVSFDFLCGPRDIISPGENGFIVRGGDVPTLAGAMARLMDDTALRLRMSEKAFEVRDTYSEDKIMETWENCFKELTNE